MRTIKKLALFSVAVFCLSSLHGQNEGVIHAVYQYRDGHVRLRWAPSESDYWALCRQYGFALERYVIDSVPTSQVAKSLLSMDPIRPADTAFWVARIEDPNPSWALFAQSIYSASVVLTLQGGLNAEQWQDVYHERQQRFALGLLACDMDFEVAKAAGLGWEDPYVRSGESYMYRLYDLIPDSIYAGDTMCLYVSTDRVPQAPMIGDVYVQGQANIARIHWGKRWTERAYVAYDVQRSADGRRFESCHDRPKVPLSDPDQSLWMLWDSIDGSTSYKYRIRGYDVFGLAGPWSNIATIEREKTAFYYAQSLQWDEPKQQLSFELDSAALTSAASFVVVRRSKMESPADTLVRYLRPDKRQVKIVLGPEETHYLQVGMLYKNGERTWSLPLLVQRVDSIPPPIPMLVHAVQDSQFVVHLRWSCVTAKDFSGYRLYRSVDREDWEPLSISLIHDTVFTDSLSPRNRQSWHYAVISEDHRGNRSQLSNMKVIQLHRAPLTSAIQVLLVESVKKGLQIHWANPYPELYGRVVVVTSEGDTLLRQRWVQGLVRDSFYIDTKALQARQSLYMQLISFDGRRSPLSAEFYVVPEEAKQIPRLVIEADRQRRHVHLVWSNVSQNGCIRIYRKKASERWVLIQTVDSSENQAIDSDLELHQRYAYRIEHVGDHRAMSDVQSLTF